MALTHTTAVRNAIADLVVDKVDQASTAGYIEIRDAAVVLATIPFPDPAFGNAGAAVAGKATANAITQTNASAAGTADNFKVYDGDDTELWSGTITATGGGGDLELSSTSITESVPCSITALSYTAPT